MKKKIALLLTAALLVQGGAAALAADYPDTKGHWAESIIDSLTEDGVVQGDGRNFRPDSDVNVDEFLKMILTAMGEEIGPAQGGYWAQPYIDRALELELIYSDEFADGYARPVTRYEIAMISTRAIDANEVTGALRDQIIGKISDYYDIYNYDKEYVLAAYANNLLYGYEDNSFRGYNNTTRAEACVIVSRVMSAGDFERPSTDNPDVPQDLGDVFYVASNGNDNNAGTADAPFATMAKAQEAVRETLKSDGAHENGITVYLRGGEYDITGSLELAYEDSGTEDCQVTWASYPGETARLTGSVALPHDAFEPIDDEMGSKLIERSAADEVLQIDLNELGITNLGRLSRRGYLIAESGVLPQAELYIDGSRQQLSRWPNSEWVGTTGIVRSGARSQSGVLEGAVFNIDYDRPTKWHNQIDQIYTAGVLGPNYFYGYFPIGEIKPGEITLREGSVTNYYSKHFIRYENIFEETDMPGEYYIDRETGMLYLYPPEGFGADTDIRLSMLEENMIAGDNVKNVTFKNLQFDTMRAGAIRITNAENVNIENCTIYGTGTHGVYLRGTNCSVKNSLIHDIGANGIQMGGGDYAQEIDSGNEITNNHIYKAAQIERSYQAGILLDYQSVGIKVSHNEIHDMPHTAVIIYGPNHTVEYNNIYDAVKEFHDMDAIYLNVYQYPWERNVVIRRNYIHDFGQQTFTERQMNVAGVRTDNNGNGLQVLENVFYNIGYQNANGIRAVCAQGIDNVVKNNIFIDLSGTYDGPHTYNPSARWDITSSTVKPIYDQWLIYSPVYSQKNPEVATFFDHHFQAYEKNNIFKDNVIVNIAFPLGTSNYQTTGQGFMASDQLVDASGNIVTQEDPGFVDYAGENFTLKPDSRVYSEIENFPEIDFENMGTLADTPVGVTQ